MQQPSKGTNVMIKTKRIAQGLYTLWFNGVEYDVEIDQHGLWNTYLFDNNARQYMQTYRTKRAAIAGITA
jgi:hypothetical protein